jgi:hypothetical protein
MYILTRQIREISYKEPIESLEYNDKTFFVSLKLYSEVFNLQFTQDTFLYDNIIEALRNIISDINFGITYNFTLDNLLELCNFLTADQKNHYRLKYNLVDRIPDPNMKPIDLEDILYDAKKAESMRRY